MSNGTDYMSGEGKKGTLIFDHVPVIVTDSGDTDQGIEEIFIKVECRILFSSPVHWIIPILQ